MPQLEMWQRDGVPWAFPPKHPQHSDDRLWNEIKKAHYRINVDSWYQKLAAVRITQKMPSKVRVYLPTDGACMPYYYLGTVLRLLPDLGITAYVEAGDHFASPLVVDMYPVTNPASRSISPWPWFIDSKRFATDDEISSVRNARAPAPVPAPVPALVPALVLEPAPEPVPEPALVPAPGGPVRAMRRPVRARTPYNKYGKDFV
jgi:hypothetical protein